MATEDWSWSIKPKANVENLSVMEAMKKYSPYTIESDSTFRRQHVIVLCSWMPMAEDWTKAFRDGPFSGMACFYHFE